VAIWIPSAVSFLSWSAKTRTLSVSNAVPPSAENPSPLIFNSSLWLGLDSEAELTRNLIQI